MYGDFPARNTVCAPYIRIKYGSGQPYVYAPCICMVLTNPKNVRYLWQESTNYTAIYGVLIWFWPALYAPYSWSRSVASFCCPPSLHPSTTCSLSLHPNRCSTSRIWFRTAYLFIYDTCIMMISLPCKPHFKAYIQDWIKFCLFVGYSIPCSQGSKKKFNFSFHFMWITRPANSRKGALASWRNYSVMHIRVLVLYFCNVCLYKSGKGKTTQAMKSASHDHSTSKFKGFHWYHWLCKFIDLAYTSRSMFQVSHNCLYA
jgi:hypothetical protein